MELKGSLTERILQNDETLSLGGLCDVYFKNMGPTPVDVGLLKLNPYEDTSFASGCTLDNKNLQITFDTEKGNNKRLYMRAIKIIDCSC